MNKYFRALTLAPACSIVLAGHAMAAGSVSPIDASDQKVILRDWTPATSIERRVIYRLGVDIDTKAQLPSNVISPDGKYFYVHTFRGDLGCRCNRSTLEIFDAKAVATWVIEARGTRPAPLVSVTMHTVQNRSNWAISDISWRDDGDALQFIGSDGSHEQAYRVDLPSGRLKQLTDDAYGKASLLSRGSTILFKREDVPVEEGRPVAPDVFALARDDSGYVAVPGMPSATREELVARYKNGPSWVLSLPRLISHTITISPDGRYATGQVKEKGGGNTFVMFDFAARKFTKIGTRPEFTTQQLLMRLLSGEGTYWTADSTWALMVAAGLPDEKPSGEAKAHVIAYQPATGRWQKLETSEMTGQRVRAAGWLKPGEELLVAHSLDDKPAVGTVYRLVDGKWVGRDVAPDVQPLASKSEAVGPLKISIKEGPNQPPQLVVSMGGHSRAFSDPDPVLERVWRAPSEPFEWTMPDGKKLVGALMLPRNAVAGHRLPLVIQIGLGGYEPDLFRPEGFAASGFAAQAMVGRGMAVLSLNYIDLPQYKGLASQEKQRRIDLREAVDRAVGALANDKNIDPNKVGLVGFSRSGNLVHYIVTHPGRTKLAAGVVNDSATLSFVEYMSDIALGAKGALESDLEDVYGGSPWSAPAAWWSEDSLLNAFRTSAPLLFTQHMRRGLVGETWEELYPSVLATIAGQERYRRAFEYLFFPNGAHHLTRPVQRLASLEANTDWMDFWLNGHEDPAPEKAEQYARWRMLKERQAKFDAEKGAKAK